MKVAISMHSLHRQFMQGEMCSIDFLKHASRLCVKGVEVADLYLPTDDEDLAAIQSKLQETGLAVACYGIEWVPNGKNERMRSGLKLAQQLGAGCIRILGNTSKHNLTGTEMENMVLRLLDSLLPEIEGKDLVLCFENQSNPDFPSERLTRLLDKIKSPQVKVCLNLANSVLAGEDPQVALDLLQPHIGYVLASDVRVDERAEKKNSPLVGAVFGLGLVPVDILLERLNAQDYQGWLTLEFTGLEEAFFGIEASLKNVHQLLYEFANKGVSASGEAWPTV